MRIHVFVCVCVCVCARACAYMWIHHVNACVLLGVENVLGGWWNQDSKNHYLCFLIHDLTISIICFYVNNMIWYKTCFVQRGVNMVMQRCVVFVWYYHQMTKQIIITVRNILKYVGEHHVCFPVWDDAACKFKQIYAPSVEKRTPSYLSTHTVYQYKIYLFIFYLGEIWPYWEMDTGKHNFHEILLWF